MRRAWWLVPLLLLLPGCRSQPTPAPAEASVDAGQAALAPATLPEFSTIAVFPDDVSISLYRLTDGVAIGERGENGWELFTAASGPHSAIQNVSAAVVSYPNDSPNAVWGSVDELWLTTLAEDHFHITRAGIAERTRTQYRFAGPLTDGQWVGVPSEGSIDTLDDRPAHFEALRPGDHSLLPVVPEKLMLTSLAFLGGAAVCGLGVNAEHGAEPQDMFRLWYRERGLSREVSVPQAKAGTTLRVLRGAGGACLVVPGGREPTPTIYALRGDQLHELGRFASAGEVDITKQGVAWERDDRSLHRLPLTIHAQETSYELPEDHDGCRVDFIREMVALADDDIWLSVGCKSPPRSALLHSQHTSALVDIPAPSRRFPH